MTQAPTLLFVCHANVCRSPMAERLARHMLASPAGLASTTLVGPRVASAGTHARLGDPMYVGAELLLRERGVDAAGFASRPVTIELVRHAELILTATREQRAICAALAPAAVSRIFTLRQFGRLAAEAERTQAPGRSRLIDLIELVRMVRGRTQPVPAADDDLDDPVNGTEADLRACADRIERALAPVARFIAAT